MASHPALLPSMCTLQTLGTTLDTGQQTLGTTLADAGQGSARHSAPVSDAVDLRGRIGDLVQPGVPTPKAFENGPALGLSGQAETAPPPGAPHGQHSQPLFVQRYVNLHIELSSLITNHLHTHESLEPFQRVELHEQLKRSLAVVQHSNLGLLHRWRSIDADALSEQGRGGLRGQERHLHSHSHSHSQERWPDAFESIAREKAEAEVDSTEVDSTPELESDSDELTFNKLSNVIAAGSEHPSFVSQRIGLPMEVNKQVRHLLLHQSKYTNRFQGSGLSAQVEQAYEAYVTQTQKPKLTRRLVGFALLILALSLAHAPRGPLSLVSGLLLLLTVVLPSFFLLIAALGCTKSRCTNPFFWQWHVVTAILAADSCINWGDLLVDFADFTPFDKDFHTMWELARFLVMLCVCAMASQCGLQLRASLALHLMVFAQYMAASITLYVLWWHRSGQGRWVWRFHDTSLEGGAAAGAAVLNLSCKWLDYRYGDGPPVGMETIGHTTVLLDCIVLAAIAMVTNMCTLHRLNHAERISFVNSYVLHSKVSDQRQLLAGERVELLALFSNPWLHRVVPTSLSHLPSAQLSAQLGPLALGRELKSLLRAVPAPYVHIEPAATLEDVRTAIKQHNPQIALFSGHSLAGSLAFELPNGHVELPDVRDFMAALQPDNGVRSDLRYLVLNGCDTIALALELVKSMPALMVVCWRSLAEDAAARAFASGFYCAIGANMVSRPDSRPESIDFEAAYEAGLTTFEEEGFVYGDPSLKLHEQAHPPVAAPATAPDLEQAHPHVAAPATAPDLERRGHHSEGCSPLVHGQPVLLCHRHGEVHFRLGTADWQKADASALVPSIRCAQHEAKRRLDGGKD